MTRPAFLPPLPRVGTTTPPDGFADAVRAAGRRRRRRAGTAAGGALTALVVLAAGGGGPGGSAGLEPTGRPPAPASAPPGAPTASPAGSAPPAVPGGPATPGPGTRDGNGPDPAERPGPTASPAVRPPVPGDDPAAPTATPAVTPTGTPSPAPSAGTARPWQRSETEADRAYLAQCVGSDDDGVGNEGTRFGDWCLTARATEETRKSVAVTFEACPVVPEAAPLTFPDGRELDVVVRDAERVLWSSATGRTFPDSARPVETRYGWCAHWRLRWPRVTDEQTYAGPGDYVVVVTLRADGGPASDRVALRLSQ